MTVTAIETTDEARALAEQLLGSERRRPVALVSIAAGQSEPFIDAARIDAELGDAVDVYTIVTGPVTFAFRDAMPPGTEAYGGAGRVYPVGTEWVEDLRVSPLRFAFDAEHASRSTENLIDDAHRMSDRARTSGRGSRHGGLVRTEAQVHAVLGDARAIVKTDSGWNATIAQERIAHGVPLGWLLSPGMRLTGLLDEQSRSFAPDRPAERASLVTDYPDGAVVLALVADVAEDAAQLLLHPWLTVRVRRGEVSQDAQGALAMLLAPGDVVAARLLRAPDGRLRLRLSDVRDDEPVLPAVPFAPGGEPWLLPERHLDIPEPPAQRSAAPASTAPASAEPAAQPTRPVPKPGPPPGAPGRTAATPRPTPPETAPAPRPTVFPTPGDLARSGGTVAVPDPERTSGKTARRPADESSAEPAPETAAGPRPAPGPHLVAAAAQRDLGQEMNTLRLEAERERLRRVRAENRIAELEQQLGGASGGAEQVEAQRAMSEAFDAERRQLAEEITKLEQRGSQMRKELSRQRDALRKANRTSSERSGRVTVDFDAFPDADEAVRFAIRSSWVAQIPAYEKRSKPLPAYRLGPDFADSLARFDEDRQAKALRAVVDVLTGARNRTVHHLKESESGPPVTRAEDGAVAWRVYIEENSPQARRLHYWQLKGGEIELARVVLHDDFSI